MNIQFPLRSSALLLLGLLLPFTTLKADGLPLNVATREVVGAHLRLPLTEVQQKEVASLGLITFNAEQLTLLRGVYPKIPQHLRVLASTFNDNTERDSNRYVDCIWLTPAEVAITIPQKEQGEEYEFDEGTDPGKTPAIEEPGFVFLRISPAGDLYHRGQQISLDGAKALIKQELILVEKAQPSGQSLAPFISVTRAPTYRHGYDEARATATHKALLSYGEGMKVRINPSW